jgi:redox-sensing transcriptional repressor
MTGLGATNSSEIRGFRVGRTHPLVKNCTRVGVGCSSRPARYAGPVERTWRNVADRPAGSADGSPRRIPEATVARLPLYYRALLEAADQDVGTVSSERLAELAGVNAAKVRKDLSYLGSYGTRGVGYEVEFLVDRITAELGLTADWPVAIVGLGNLGQALANYRGFGARGFRVLALVDADKAKVGEVIGDLAIESTDDLAAVVRERGIKIGIIATPAAAAQEVADQLVAAGVCSILNFAPAVVAVPDTVSLRKVDLAIELQILSFYQSHPQRSRAKQKIS